jgi:GTP cyclohydrolase I
MTVESQYQEPVGHDMACAAVRQLLLHIGEDPERDGLRDTPARVVKMLHEITAGQRQDPREILGRVFEEPCDEMVILKEIAFHSTCEHHLLNFRGTVAIGYLPGKVVGISKLARLVECYARRLQIQERLTQQIACAVETHLEARGVGVVVRAHHSCMGCRGVRQANTVMITSTMLGRLRESSEARAEFLKLAL